MRLGIKDVSLGQTVLRFGSSPLVNRLKSQARVFAKYLQGFVNSLGAAALPAERDASQQLSLTALMHHTSSQDQFVGVVLLWRLAPTPVCPCHFPPPQHPEIVAEMVFNVTVPLNRCDGVSNGGLFHPSIVDTS